MGNNKKVSLDTIPQDEKIAKVYKKKLVPVADFSRGDQNKISTATFDHAGAEECMEEEIKLEDALLHHVNLLPDKSKRRIVIRIEQLLKREKSPKIGGKKETSVKKPVDENKKTLSEENKKSILKKVKVEENKNKNIIKDVKSTPENKKGIIKKVRLSEVQGDEVIPRKRKPEFTPNEKVPLKKAKIQGTPMPKQSNIFTDSEDESEDEEMEVEKKPVEITQKKGFWKGKVSDDDDEESDEQESEDEEEQGTPIKEHDYKPDRVDFQKGRGNRGKFGGRGGFSPGNRGGNRGNRGFSPGNRGGNRGNRGFSPGNRGGNRGNRGFSPGNRGGNRGNRGGNRGGNRFSPGDRGGASSGNRGNNRGGSYGNRGGGNIHPSWAAKQQQKQAAGKNAPKPKRIVFDE